LGNNLADFFRKEKVDTKESLNIPTLFQKSAVWGTFFAIYLKGKDNLRK
jgi:hypothetical protein